MNIQIYIRMHMIQIYIYLYTCAWYKCTYTIYRHNAFNLIIHIPTCMYLVSGWGWCNNTVYIDQVNSGVLGVCTAFLSGEPATRLRSQELQQLIAALLEFMAVCKRAIRIHSRLIGEEDQEFHSQLVNGFQSLTAELSHYIPAILSELWCCMCNFSSLSSPPPGPIFM